MATHSSILAWEIPGTEEPGGLQSMGSQKDGHNWGVNNDTGMRLTLFISQLPPGAPSRTQSCPTQSKGYKHKHGV